MRQNVLDVYEARLNALRQIDLRYIPCNHGLGIVAQPGEKHFHLIDGGILGFVENDKSIVQGAAPHKCEWRDFKRVHFHQMLQLRIG